MGENAHIEDGLHSLPTEIRWPLYQDQRKTLKSTFKFKEHILIGNIILNLLPCLEKDLIMKYANLEGKPAFNLRDSTHYSLTCAHDALTSYEYRIVR